MGIWISFPQSPAKFLDHVTPTVIDFGVSCGEEIHPPKIRQQKSVTYFSWRQQGKGSVRESIPFVVSILLSENIDMSQDLFFTFHYIWLVNKDPYSGLL